MGAGPVLRLWKRTDQGGIQSQPRGDSHGAGCYGAGYPVRAGECPWEQVESVHHLSERFPVAGGEAAICPEDGYVRITKEISLSFA